MTNSNQMILVDNRRNVGSQLSLLLASHFTDWDVIWLDSAFETLDFIANAQRKLMIPGLVLIRHWMPLMDGRSLQTLLELHFAPDLVNKTLTYHIEQDGDPSTCSRTLQHWTTGIELSMKWLDHRHNHRSRMMPDPTWSVH